MNFQEAKQLAKANPGTVIQRSSAKPGEWVVLRKGDLSTQENSTISHHAKNSKSRYRVTKRTRSKVTKVPSKFGHSEEYQPYPSGTGKVEDNETETWLQEMGVKEGEKPADRVGVAPKREKDYPLRYIDEGIAGTREDNKRSRAQNLSDLNKRKFE